MKLQHHLLGALLLVTLATPDWSWAESSSEAPVESSRRDSDVVENSSPATSSENGDEDEIHPSSLDELELELEQPEKRHRGGSARAGQGGWSAWSHWSTCSRTCDGGASYQLRRCKAEAGCRGEPVRYRICNMQPCPDPSDFREQQCLAYNEVPYNGALLSWSPHQDDADPCALTCSTRVPGREGRTLVVQLAPKVQDGTRCRIGSLDMCISGKCQRVGCDLRIGSTKRVDECGVCGGDGSSCARPMFHWEETATSLCSATCGGGQRLSRPVCRNRLTGNDVDDQLCNAKLRPTVSSTPCNTQRCPPKYVVGEYGPCSVTCGGGTRYRPIFCAEETNGTHVKVPEHFCHGHKPRYQEQCNTADCPEWDSGEWSGCSVSCGEGHQTRRVVCRDTRGDPDTRCEPARRPPHQQPCRTGIECPTPAPTFARSRVNLHGNDDELGNHDYEVLPGLDHTQPLVQPYPPANAERLIDEQVTPSESMTFITKEWGACSVTCGEGIRTREVHCQIFLEFSRTTAILPDNQCQGPKPESIERCFMPNCPKNGHHRKDPEVQATMASSSHEDLAEVGSPEHKQPCLGPLCSPLRDGHSQSGQQLFSMYGGSGGSRDRGDGTIRVAARPSGKSDKETYSWQEQGYTYCSASCLGGVQELIVNCIQESDNKVVSPFLCPLETRPIVLTRTCNDVPCPPRWNYSDFQACSKSCGIGIQLRDVTCIHEVTRGGGNTVVVPNSMCPQPPPPDRQYCNILDCPVRWHTTEWSKCSRSCGGGSKTRRVECMQVMAQNHPQPRPTSMCPPGKPAEQKPCNTKPCDPGDNPHIASTNGTYVQQSPKKKVTLKIGGQAAVFWGTQIKIKCPVKKYNRTKILWAKDHKYINNSKKYKISKKGALRIQDVVYRDSGIYTCIAGRSSADLTLTVKPRPGVFPNSEEVERPTGPTSRQINNQVDPLGFGSGNVGQGGADTGSDAAYALITGHMGEAREPPQPFNTLEDHSHELGGPPLPPRSTPRPPWQDRSSSRKHQQHRPEDQEYGSHLKPGSSGYGGSESPVSLASPQPPAVPPPPHEEDLSFPSSSSAAARPMPHFQRLLASFQNLWPFQSFSNSRGHRMVPFDEAKASALADTHGFERHYEDNDDDRPGPIVILGKGSKENLKFEWVAKPWSKCSQSCGGNGYQVREATCMVRLHNTSQQVEPNLCLDAGLDPPSAHQSCGHEECPRWIPGAWTPCELSRCFTWNTAMQRRDVSCVFPNGSSAENTAAQCNERNKPPQRQECYNDKCKGTWKVGEWYECSAACEAQGIKYRILQCVWFGTKRPAGNACRDQPRPAVMKVCKGPPCKPMAECRDQSNHCKRVKAMNLCRVYSYQYQCCQTCRGITPASPGG